MDRYAVMKFPMLTSSVPILILRSGVRVDDLHQRGTDMDPKK